MLKVHNGCKRVQMQINAMATYKRFKLINHHTQLQGHVSFEYFTKEYYTFVCTTEICAKRVDIANTNLFFQQPDVMFLM